jgi:hypothetical protein
MAMAIDIAIDSVARNSPMFNVNTPIPVPGYAKLVRWPLVEPYRRRTSFALRWLRQNGSHVIQSGADLTSYPDFSTNDSQVGNRNVFDNRPILSFSS